MKSFFIYKLTHVQPKSIVRNLTKLIETTTLPITIGYEAFRGNTSLTTVTMTEVTTIGNSAFKDNTALTTVEMPNVTTIEKGAFKGNTALIKVTLPRLFDSKTDEYFPLNLPNLNFIFIDHQI